MFRNLKAISQLFVVMSLLLCMVTGCATNSGSNIVGKWYNEKGKCLDIRSDGTYTLEDSYGTGTWKLLDDHETYEFLDYYGDSQETKINVDELGEYVDFGYYGDFYKDLYSSANMQNNAKTNESEQDIQVLRAKTNEGFYEVEFKKEDKTYCGIADASGQIFYYTDNYSGGEYWSGVDFTPIGENAGYLCESQDGKMVYTIINSSGTEKIFSGDNFDKILGKGGGYILVYKNTGTISKEEHSYGLINSEGEWEVPLTPGTKIRNDALYAYAGEKVFIQCDYYGNGNHYIVFDCDKNLTIGLDNCTIMGGTVNNGKFIVAFKSWFSSYCIPYNSTKNELNGYFMFSTDGSYQEMRELKNAFGEILIYEETKGETKYIQIYDLESESLSQYDDFPADSISNIAFVDKYGLLTINGRDGNNYFTIIDAHGEQQFEPRICVDTSNIEFYGDRTIYKNQNGYFEMIDNKGNLIISEEKKCSSLVIDGDSVSGKIKGTDVYFDKDGHEITFSLKK